MTQHAVSHAETPLEALLLEEALLLAHQLETTAAATRELARQAVQAALQALAAAYTEGAAGAAEGLIILGAGRTS